MWSAWFSKVTNFLEFVQQLELLIILFYYIKVQLIHTYICKYFVSYKNQRSRKRELEN